MERFLNFSCYIRLIKKFFNLVFSEVSFPYPFFWSSIIKIWELLCSYTSKPGRTQMSISGLNKMKYWVREFYSWWITFNIWRSVWKEHGGHKILWFGLNGTNILSFCSDRYFYSENFKADSSTGKLVVGYAIVSAPALRTIVRVNFKRHI